MSVCVALNHLFVGSTCSKPPCHAVCVGLAVLESIEEDKLQENARIQGEYCMQLLEELKARHV